ncbi:MAG: hypothetical protein M1298_03950 [Chloroflexi bacterium]|nr:hypothetical protein [Chloroflexota bacterium]
MIRQGTTASLNVDVARGTRVRRRPFMSTQARVATLFLLPWGIGFLAPSHRQ